MKFIANLFSVVFHPLLMVFYTSLLVLYAYDFLPLREVKYQYILLSLVFVFSFIIPGVFIVFMYRFKIITDLKLADRKERILPYFMTAFFYAFVSYLLYTKSFIDPLVYKIMFFGAIVIAVSAIINLKFKISSHALSCAVVLGMVLHLSYNYDSWHQVIILLSVFLITGIVSSSRLYLRAHDSFEIIMGMVIGLILGIISPFIIF